MKQKNCQQHAVDAIVGNRAIVVMRMRRVQWSWVTLMWESGPINVTIVNNQAKFVPKFSFNADLWSKKWLHDQ